MISGGGPHCLVSALVSTIQVYSQMVLHTNAIGGKNSALPHSYAADEIDGAAICKHYSSLKQIVGIPMGRL